MSSVSFGAFELKHNLVSGLTGNIQFLVAHKSQNMSLSS